LNVNGHEAKIVARYDFDIYRHTQDSDAAVMVDTSRDFVNMGIKLIREWKPDVIHVSGTLKMLVIARAIAPRGLIVFSYHGADARNPSKKPHGETKLADFVHVSTPDLTHYGTWIDRPIDSKFHYRGGRVKGSVLMFYKSHFYVDNREFAEWFCLNRGWTLTILDEDHPDFPIPNDHMPELFSKYDYYLDWKGQKEELSALSKTALEALACGCTVIHDNDMDHEIRQSDIEQVQPIRYFQLYQELLLRELPTLTRTIKRIPRLVWYLAKFAKERLL